MSKLNAFLAAIPANGLPSPTTCKGTGVPANKAFPSLSIPQAEEEDDNDHNDKHEANDDNDDDDGMIAVDEPEKVASPATPQPQFLRHRAATAAALAGHSRGATVRDIARRFDSQKSFSASLPPPSLSLASDHESPVNSNQEDEATTTTTTTTTTTNRDRKGSTSSSCSTAPLPPLSPATPQASTPHKARASSSAGRSRQSVDDGEAGPLKRHSATHQLQQQQQQQGQHHRRVSTDTATFSKMLTRRPHEDIDTRVVQYFAQLRVPTISRPANNTSSHHGNQAEDHDYDVSETETETPAIDPLELLTLFQRGETVSVETALTILQRATDVMTLEPNVVAAPAPVTVVGDLHGQFSDLVALFRVHGAPSATNPFVFLGDYVDRGVASCEIILSLLAFKSVSPRHVVLLRGNHECRSLSTFYGFRAECLAKYGLAVYNRAIQCFESMPLAATIATARGTFLAVHGGLSPSIERVEQINELIDRFTEPDPSGALCDLLWADPAKDTSDQHEAFAPNAVRGCSYTFSERVCREFLARNHLLAIIRAHELEEHGFREHFQSTEDHDEHDEHETLPPVITVFSAPEYCNTNHNMGATLAIAYDTDGVTTNPKKLLTYRQHTRSTQREAAFTGASEHDAVAAFLREQLPFLPVDFYELVVVCRQLQASLDVAAAIATPVASSASLVSSASNVMHDSPVLASSAPPSTKHKRRTIATTVAAPRAEERRSLDHTSTQGDTATSTPPTAAPRHTVLPVTPAPYVRAATHKPSRRASTGSGLRLCPGFVRFCEKFLGLQFHETPHVRTTFIIEPKKRRSIDDIHVGTTHAPCPSPVRPIDVAEIQLSPSDLSETMTPVATPVVEPSTASGGSTTKQQPLEIFTATQWTALRLYFSLLDVSGTGVLMEESFVVLLAEQDSDAYATQDELHLLLDVVDGNGDGLITMQDFLQFAYRALLRWNKHHAPPRRNP